jgi:hypothetical protein
MPKHEYTVLAVKGETYTKILEDGKLYAAVHNPNVHIQIERANRIKNLLNEDEAKKVVQS